MSLKQAPRTRATETEAPTRPETDPEELLGLLTAEYTQKILAAIRKEAKPARTLAEECGASRPTVYRRLNSLQDAGLVESDLAYDADGHHRMIFDATLESVRLDVTDDGLSVSLSTHGSRSS